jgi:membrane fusion protein, copper/silver efflux system
MNRHLLTGLIVGAVIASLVTWLLLDGGTPDSATEVEREPLYWVAPMDPDYRRDQPGKSPMGMDLVPVYADAAAADDPGVVRISPDVENNLGVRTVVVARELWETDIRTVGYVTFDQDRLLHIHPRVAGWVETLHVKASGDPVSPGQALYELYAPELVNAQEEFLLATKRNNALLVDAARDRLRSLQLSDEFIDRLQRTGRVMQNVTFRAGQGGVVDNLAIREGFYVQPGTTMLSIGTLDEVWVEAEIFERQVTSVDLGMPVTMTTDFLPGRVWQGSVNYIYPTLDPQTRTVRVRLRFTNEDHLLKPNMFAQVTIHAIHDEEVLTIPRESLIRTGTQDRVVLALGEGRFKSLQVEVGRVGNATAEILAGVEAGDEIVASAHFLLDSESSKSSEFRRMHHGPAEDAPMDHGNMDHEQMNHD